ncbi:PTS sugar transporter subunit IIA [Enterococcus faecalis]|nr:PTS sugar transporter subunit IIA [Enterococcus faecalis]EJY9662281.1 PTS sugar transporter subunit IIA [Enterococcus faecalis]
MFEITAEQIMLNQSYASWEEALAASGELLLKNQLVTPDYVKAMYQRQQKVSVYIGNFVALPHAEGQDEQVLIEGICFIQVPDGVNFGTEADRKIATLLFVVALKSQRQLSMLQELAFFCSDLENIQRLSDCQTIDEAQKILAQA